MRETERKKDRKEEVRERVSQMKGRRQRLFVLQESRLVLGLVVVSKLDLALVAGKIAGLVEGDRMRAVQDVVTGLKRKKQK